MNASPLVASGFLWGSGGEKLTPEQLERRRKVADALRQREGYVPAGWMSLLGSLAGEGVAAYKDAEIDKQESEAQKRVADALLAARGGTDPNAYLDVLGDPFASPQQQAVASALYQQAQPSFRTIEQGGDIYRWNENDPGATPELWFDGPDPVSEAYHPMTAEERAAWGIPEDDTTPYALGPDNMPKAISGGKPLVTVNTGGTDDKFFEEAAKKRGENFSAIEAAGYQAQTKIGQINRLEELLAAAPQGLEGGWKQIAGEIGIATDGLDDIQASQALINKLVPEQRTPGSGPMSDADLALFKQSMPRIINQPGGNELILQTLKGIAVYEQTMGNIASRVLNREINPETGKPYTPADAQKEMAAIPNPLELFRGGAAGGSEGGYAPAGVDPEVWAEMTPEERALWN